MTLSDPELALLRMEIGDAAETAFTDEELQTIYTASAEDMDSTLYRVYRILCANAAKFNDYTAGQTEEKRQQVFANLLKLRDRYAATVASNEKKAGQVRLTSFRTVPPRRKRRPR